MKAALLHDGLNRRACARFPRCRHRKTDPVTVAAGSKVVHSRSSSRRCWMRLQRLARGLCSLAILWIVLINLRQAHQAHNSSGAEAQYQHQGRVATVALPRDTRTRTPDRRWTVGQLAAVGVKPKAFTWNGTVPCYEPDDLMKLSNGYRQPAKDGLLFLKTIKTGGSTATGITMRIAKHTAERNQKKYWICRGRWDHQWAIRLLKERVRDRSFTWTVIRDPTERAISDFSTLVFPGSTCQRTIPPSRPIYSKRTR
jgi:hypothetical protein